MNKDESLIRYPKMDMHILKYYEDADEYQWFNLDDPDLHPIRTRLPECPDWHRITNFGIAKEKQIFTKEEMPSTLQYLIDKTSQKIRTDRSLTTTQKREDAFYDWIWEELESSLKYKKALEWISDQWYYRTYGKWIFINGKPTYIPKNHWFYLNYWTLESVGLPEYRDRDREWFWAMEYFKQDTTAPKRDEDDNLLYNDDGSLQLRDAGYRTVDGVIVAKGRRAGDTTKATCDIWCDTSAMIDGKCGIQGDKEDTGRQVFDEKLMHAFRRLPFFWKPKINHNVQNELIMDSKEDDSLGAKIDYKSAHPTAYDGRRLDRYYADEPGKIEKYSVHERHSIVRLCLRKGTRLMGFSIYTTTVSDMTSDAGRNFEKLCRNSFFNDRVDSASTKTGMIFIHIKASHGHEGFIGPYGESVVDEPNEVQLKYIDKQEKNKEGKWKGAKDDLLMEREALREDGQYEKVSELKRLHPLSFAESFAPPANNVYFNTDILEQRVIELKRKPQTIRGNFIGDPVIGVSFMPDTEGRFEVSKLLPPTQSNLKYLMGGNWHPQNPTIYVASADVFKSDKDRVEGYQMSAGGGSILWKFDPRTDPETKPVEEWESGTFVCTYRFRPDTTDEFNEEMLRMCVYFGALMYPENNIDLVWKYFVARGFSGYLLYDTDTNTGRPRVTPGFHSGGEMKKKLFNLTRNYISAHGRREKHLDYLEECLAIRNPDQMTRFDLFTSCGGCLLGNESSYGEYLTEGDTFDIGGLI